jgi:hypothetical protein
VLSPTQEISMSNPNEKTPDQKSDQGHKPGQQTETRQKSEIRKAVKEDNPNNKPQGQEKTGYSGGT